MKRVLISVKNLSVQQPGKSPLLHDINFEVYKGEVFGILGESGAGKTLLTHVLTGFFPYEGDIKMPQDVQLVPQDPVKGLHPRHTVQKVLQEPMVLRKDCTDMEKRIEQALKDVHLTPDCLKKFPHELSGGQRQRVCIARALVSKPTVVFLDEPTSALDAYIRSCILDLLKDIKKRRHLTYFFVAHSLTAMTRLCDRIAVMRKGKILEIVENKDLLALNVSHPYTKELIQAYKDLAA